MRVFSHLASLLLLAASLVATVSTKPAQAQQFLATQIENLVSTDTMKVKIDGLSGALTGDIRIENVTVSDPQGVFLTAKNLAMDWSPFGLIRSNVSIDNLTAGQIILERLPTGQPPAATDSSGGGFSLPSISAQIKTFAIEEFVLGEAIAGTRARLKMNASLNLSSDPTNLSVKANIDRIDQPGQIALDIAYAPAQNQLTLDVNASEPAGGLVATLLDIPDRPAVNLTIKGSGPLSNYMANGQLDVGGEQAAMLTARTNDTDQGREVSASLMVAAQRFVPEQYSRYVQGGANLDVQLLMKNDGTYAISQGQLASDAVQLTTTGTLDLDGAQNDLTLALASRDGNPIPFSLGTPPTRTSLQIASLNGTLKGALTNADVAVSAKMPAGGYGEYQAQGVSADVTSQGFDVKSARGPLKIVLAAQKVDAPEGIQNRLLDGPVTITVDGALTNDGLQFNPSTAKTGTAEIALNGTATLNFSVFDLNVDTTVQTNALSAAAIPIAGDTVSLKGNFTRSPQTTIAVNDLALTSQGLTVNGNAALADGGVSADITGQLQQASSLSSTLAGSANFALKASGPVEKPDVDLTLDGNGLSINGRKLADLKVEARGSLNPASPNGSVAITGTLDGQPLSGNAKIATLDSGERRISDIAIRQGPNAITGDLRLTDAFAPIGTLDVNVDDIGPLAALGGLDASGDVKGAIDLSVKPDKTPVAGVQLNGNSLSVAGNTLQGARIDLSVADYLGIPKPTGTVTASAINATSLAVTNLEVALTEQDQGTGLTTDATVNGVPVSLAGSATFEPNATLLMLSKLTAAIPDAAVALQNEARVSISGGTTTLSGLDLKVGNGSIALGGTSGQNLDLTAKLENVPAAAANPFVPGLAAAGTISGNATVTGTAASPDARFDISAKDLAVSQSRTANVPPIQAQLAGSYVGNVLTLATGNIDLGDGSIVATGTVGDQLDLDVKLDAVPVALANGFVDGLDAEGTISGTATATGPRADPSATFDLSGTGITAPQIASAGIQPLTLKAAGSYADKTATISEANIDVGDGSLSATGTVGETLDVSVKVDNFPVGLANGVVPNLDATGTISGTASATGPLGNPNATFDLSGSGITTQKIADSGIAPLTLRLAGTYAEKTANLQTAVVNVGDGTLRASGKVGQDLDLKVDMSQIPVGLANGFVPNLDASGTISGSATATGTLQNPNAQFDLSGTGITTKAIADGGIDPLTLVADGRYADGTLNLQNAQVNVGANGKGGSLTASGQVGQTLDLKLALNQLPVGLANGFVSGLGAEGTLSGNGTATGSISDPQAQFDLSGTGITTRQIAQSGIAPLTLAVDGAYANKTATIRQANLKVGDGSLNASGTIGQTIDFKASLDKLPVGLANGFVEGLGAEGTISGSATASGTLSDPQAVFDLSGSGITTRQVAQSGVAPLNLDAAGSYGNGTATIRRANVNIGDGSLSAMGTVGQTLDIKVDLRQLPVGIANGFVDDLGAKGTISGSATATGSLSDPKAVFNLTGSGITTRQVAESGVAPLTLDAAGSYASGTATIQRADVAVGDGSLSAAGTVGQTLDLKVDLRQLPVGLANGFVPDLNARGTISGTATATGSLSDPQARFDLTGSGITTRQIAQSGTAPLSLDAAGSYASGTATIDKANVQVGNGSLRASGTVGQNLDVDVKIDKLPVGLANGFVDGLGAQGTLSGTATATGSISAPNARFDISASGVSVAQSRAAGAPALAAIAQGTYAGDTLNLANARVTVGGGTITANGTVSPNALNVTANINALPASIASAAASGIAPQGTINGSVRATGSPSNPSVNYDIRASGVSIQQTRAAGVGALGITTSGRFANKVATTNTKLTGGGLDFSANGSVNIAGTPQLNLALNGTAPLSLANRILAEGGRSVQGTVRVDARVNGAATAPNVTGTISTAGAQFTDTNFNLAIRNINATIALAGQQARIQNFSGQLAAGGTLQASGTVGLNNGFPANIKVQLINGRYNDGELIGAQLSADLTLTGPLTGTPTLAGAINASEINILVPEKLPSSLARIDVTHRNAKPAVYQQQRELYPNRGKGASAGGGINLDLTFNAPNRVFVRGRGLDLELGGSIRVTGSAASPNIVGGFDLRRGRFGILGKRLNFTRGRLSFSGGLIPTLDLLAESTAGDTTVFIAVTGPATDPSFTFSSNPALPQDEVLARLIFNQGTSNLSPLQIAQLAEAAASLAGVGGSTGLLENLRSQIGVDDIDIKTTADGQTAVGVGKYLNDRTYLGVDSTGRASIDLDLGKGLKARGAVTATGGGEVGVFYEGEF